MKMRKMYNQSTRFCEFQNWTTCQKQLKSTELDKSVIIKQNKSKGKTKDDVIHNPIWVNFGIWNVSLVYTLDK